MGTTPANQPRSRSRWTRRQRKCIAPLLAMANHMRRSGFRMGRLCPPSNGSGFGSILNLSWTPFPYPDQVESEITLAWNRYREFVRQVRDWKSRGSSSMEADRLRWFGYHNLPEKKR